MASRMIIGSGYRAVPRKRREPNWRPAMIKGSGISNNSSPTLKGAHDLDAVAWAKRRLRPGGAGDDLSIESDRNPALTGVDRLFLQQSGERRDAERLVLAVDPDVRLHSGLHHGSLLHSAAARARAPNPSMPNGRIDGSATPSRTSPAMASAVRGVNRIPC